MSKLNKIVIIGVVLVLLLPLDSFSQRIYKKTNYIIAQYEQIIKGLEKQNQKIDNLLQESSLAPEKRSKLKELSSENNSKRADCFKNIHILDKFKEAKPIIKSKWRKFLRMLEKNIDSASLYNGKIQIQIDLIHESLLDANYIKVRVKYKTSEFVLSDSSKQAIKHWLSSNILEKKERQVQTDSIYLLNQIQFSDFLFELKCLGYADIQTYSDNDEEKTMQLTYERAKSVANYLDTLLLKKYKRELIDINIVNISDREKAIKKIESAMSNKKTNFKIFFLITFEGRGRELPPNTIPNGKRDDPGRKVALVKCETMIPKFRFEEK